MIKLSQLLEVVKLNSVKEIEPIRSELAAVAQKVYDDWVQDEHGNDEELGSGGICELIADELIDVLYKHNINRCQTVSSCHEQHVYVVGQFREGIYLIDIPYSYYESGGAFTWKKKPNVKFDGDYIHVERLDINPRKLKQYTDEFQESTSPVNTKGDYIGGIVQGEVRAEPVETDKARSYIHNDFPGLYSGQNSTNWRYSKNKNLVTWNLPPEEEDKDKVTEFLFKRGIKNPRHKSMYTYESKSLNELEYPLASKDELQSYGGMENWKGKIVWMTPEKFLKLCHPLPDYHQNEESMKNLEHRMKNGLPLDFLVLSIDVSKRKVIGHEGRHRATVAKKLGIKEVPVLIYTGSNFKRVPQWDKTDHEMADKAEFKPEWDRT